MRHAISTSAARNRRVTSVRLTVLRGHSVECSDVDSAIAYLIEEEKSVRLREDGERRLRQSLNSVRSAGAT